MMKESKKSNTVAKASHGYILKLARTVNSKYHSGFNESRFMLRNATPQELRTFYRIGLQ